MAGMREWLDKHRCAPSMFKYHLEQESVIIEVEFKEEEEAEIFKQYFDRAKTIWIFSRCSGVGIIAAVRGLGSVEQRANRRRGEIGARSRLEPGRALDWPRLGELVQARVLSQGPRPGPLRHCGHCG
jgi:hypothetical protein